MLVNKHRSFARANWLASLCLLPQYEKLEPLLALTILCYTIYAGLSFHSRRQTQRVCTCWCLALRLLPHSPRRPYDTEQHAQRASLSSYFVPSTASTAPSVYVSQHLLMQTSDVVSFYGSLRRLPDRDRSSSTSFMLAVHAVRERFTLSFSYSLFCRRSVRFLLVSSR